MLGEKIMLTRPLTSLSYAFYFPIDRTCLQGSLFHAKSKVASHLMQLGLMCFVEKQTLLQF